MKFGKKNKKDSEQIVENGSESGGADLTKLSKKDLLEIMLRQGEEIDALRAEVQSLKDQLEAREIDINRVGSLAEASLAVTEIFKEADKAAMTYLSNLKRMTEGGMKK
jgi:AmiR/NasT family two-component response regulator